MNLSIFIRTKNTYGHILVYVLYHLNQLLMLPSREEIQYV